MKKGWRKHSLMHSLLIIGHPLATTVVLQCKKSWDLPCMEGGRMSHSFITFPSLYAPPPPPLYLEPFLSCLVLPSPSSDSKLLISSSSSLLTYTLINCVLILIMRSSRVGPWRGRRSIGTTPITPHDVAIILHALHSKCRWFILFVANSRYFWKCFRMEKCVFCSFKFRYFRRIFFCYFRDSFSQNSLNHCLELHIWVL